MICRGQAVYAIQASEDGTLSLRTVSSWDVSGAGDRDTCRYNCDLPAPNGSRSVSIPWEGVLHFAYACDPARQWTGLGPIQLSSATSVVLGNLEQSIVHEAGGTVGRLLPIPADGDDDTVEGLKADLKGMNGRRLSRLVPGKRATIRGSTGLSIVSVPSSQTLRYSPRSKQQRPVAGACGVPIELLFSGSSQTAAREAWRRLLHGTVQPLGELMVRSYPPSWKRRVDQLRAVVCIRSTGPGASVSVLDGWRHGPGAGG